MSGIKKSNRRIFVECSHTYLVGGSSGIRRVARNLANVHERASSEEVRVFPLVWAGRCFLRPRRPLTEATHPVLVLAHKLLGCIALTSRIVSAVAHWPIFARLREPVKAILRRLCQGWKGGVKRRDNDPDNCGSSELTGAQISKQSPEHRRRNSDGFYNLFGLLMWPLGFAFVKRVSFRQDDIVVLVDSTWDSPAMLEALFAARERDGILVAPMFHDLFPLTMPQMCQASTVAGYSGWFQQVTAGADFFITNSYATTRTLEGYLKQEGLASALSVPAGNFRLGAELHNQPRASQSATLPPSLSGFVVLAVGTIEPRKNYKIILDALDLLWDNGSVSLVIVGRPGWHSDEIMDRIREHPQQGVRLFHLDDADDNTLDACYQRANALVCASWAEGFGLPIVEGMRHGAPVLASDIDAFREVGGDACNYFAPDRPEELAAELNVLVRLWKAGAPVQREACDLAISWEESAIQFRDEVLRLACAASSRTVSVDSAARSQL